MPKINRPVAMTMKTGVAAVISAPIMQITPNSSVALRVPMRSMMKPPINTVAMGAML